MTSYGAVWYPGPSGEPDLDLSPEDLEAVAAQLEGTPVTYDHRGVFDVVGSGRTFAEVGAAEPVKGPIGVVTGGFVDADGVGRCVIRPEGPLVSAMMAENVVPAVSLSHGRTDSGIAVVEMSLTFDPARAGSNVETTLTCDDPLAEYMSYASTKRKTSPATAMEVDTPAPATAIPTEAPAEELTDCEKAIATLSEEHRKVICDRMEEMAGRAQKAAAREKDMEASLNEYKAKWNTDVAVTREAMKDLVAQMGADTAERWRIGGIADTMGSSLEARDLYNLVCASNEALRRARSGDPAPARRAPETAAPAPKRTRVEPPAAAAPAPAKPQSMSLRAALASTFEA